MKLYRLKYGDSTNILMSDRHIWHFMAVCWREMSRDTAASMVSMGLLGEDHFQRVDRYRDHIVGIQYEPYTWDQNGQSEERLAVFLLLDCPVARLMWRLEGCDYGDQYEYRVEIESET